MGKVRDALLGAAALGDVLVGRKPAAVGQRLVDDLDRAPVGRRDHHGVADADVAQHEVDVALDVALERTGQVAMHDDVAEAAAGPDDVGG